MNSLALSLVAISSANLHGKPLPTSPGQQCSAKLVPRPFRGLQNIFWFRYSIDKGGNSLPEKARAPLYLPHDKSLQAPSPDLPIPKKALKPRARTFSWYCYWTLHWLLYLLIFAHVWVYVFNLWCRTWEFEFTSIRTLCWIQLTDILHADNSKRCKIWNIKGY